MKPSGYAGGSLTGNPTRPHVNEFTTLQTAIFHSFLSSVLDTMITLID